MNPAWSLDGKSYWAPAKSKAGNRPADPDHPLSWFASNPLPRSGQHRHQIRYRPIETPCPEGAMIA